MIPLWQLYSYNKGTYIIGRDCINYCVQSNNSLFITKRRLLESLFPSKFLRFLALYICWRVQPLIPQSIHFHNSYPHLLFFFRKTFYHFFHQKARKLSSFGNRIERNGDDDDDDVSWDQFGRCFVEGGNICGGSRPGVFDSFKLFQCVLQQQDG